MRWGRRRAAQESIATVPSHNSEDHNRKVALKKKKLNEMTNEELRAFTQRMALEKQYKEIRKAEISFGRKIVNGMIDSATKGATDMALNYANKQAAKMVEKLIKNATKAVT